MSVDVGPRRRLVQKVMSDCLSLIRLYGDCDEAAKLPGLPMTLIIAGHKPGGCDESTGRK